MTRRKPSIEDLIKADRLERIQPDGEEAHDLLTHAKNHLKSAEKLLEDDSAGAYQLLYDAARKAVAADMTDKAYRANRIALALTPQLFCTRKKHFTRNRGWMPWLTSTACGGAETEPNTEP